MTQPNDAGARENRENRENEEVRRVSGELAARLSTLGIRTSGTESAEDLLRMVEAVDRFEAAVESHGGDLMMDEGPRGNTTEPDDRHFALPVRREHETVTDYLERLARATDQVRHHPRRAD
jgi:hypothetical protein